MAGIKDWLMSNPYGWGALPPAGPDAPPDLRSGNTGFGDAVAYYTDNPELGAFASKAGDTAETVARSLSGLDLAEDAGTNLAQAIDEGSVVRGAGALAEAGLAAMPYTKAGQAAFSSLPGAFAMGQGYAHIPAIAQGAYTVADAAEAQSAPNKRKGAFEPAPYDAESGLNQAQWDRYQALRRKVDRDAMNRAERKEYEGLSGVVSKSIADRNAANQRLEELRVQEELKQKAKAADEKLKLETKKAEDDAAAAERARLVQEAKDKEKAYYDQPFAQRHPAWNNTMLGLGYALPGAIAGASIAKINKSGRNLVSDAVKAREAGDIAKLQESTKAVENWDKWLLPKQVGAIGVAAAQPMEMRGIADAIDKFTLPPDSEAKEAASERLGEPLEYIKDGIPAIVGGLTLAGAGAKAGSWLSPSPRNEITALKKLYGRQISGSTKRGKPIYEDQTPEQLQAYLARQAAATAKLQGPLQRRDNAFQDRADNAALRAEASKKLLADPGASAGSAAAPNPQNPSSPGPSGKVPPPSPTQSGAVVPQPSASAAPVPVKQNASTVKKQQVMATKIAKAEEKIKVREALDEAMKLKGTTFKGRDAARRTKLYGDLIKNNPELSGRDVAMAVERYFDENRKAGILSLAVGAGLGGMGMRSMEEE